MIEEENVLCETALFTTCLVETVAHRVLAGGESAFGLLGPNHISSTCNVDSSAGLEIICNAQHALWAEPVKCSNAVRSHHRFAAQRKSISSSVSPTFFPSHNSSPATCGRNEQLGLDGSCQRRFARSRLELSHSPAAERLPFIDARSPPACLQHVYTEWHQETKRHNSIATEWISM